jgi:hypothetical protein
MKKEIATTFSEHCDGKGGRATILDLKGAKYS